VPGRLVEVTSQYVTWVYLSQTWKVPLSALSIIWLSMPQGPDTDEGERLRNRLAVALRTRDVLILQNGDTVEGLLTKVDAQMVYLEAANKILQVDRNKVAVIALNNELGAPVRPPGVYGRLVLRDGCRLSLASAEYTTGQPVRAVTLFKAPVVFQLGDLVGLTIFQGASVYLSDLKPIRVEYRSFGTENWIHRPDAAVNGRDLCLAGSTFDKGLGMHSHTRLTFDLGGRFRRFESLVGLDPHTGRRGSVRIRVLVDGKERPLEWEKDLTGGSLPRPVRLELVGSKELTLGVEFGEGGPVQDHVNWAEARLIKR
jgi:hypothetical protein